MRKKEEVKVYFDEIENTYSPHAKKWRILYSWLDTLVFAAAVVLVIFVAFFRTASVVGPSMESTLKENDRLIIKSLNMNYERGDIVVISQPDEVNMLISMNNPIIKRVIAVEGDVVDIDFTAGKVKVNGEVLNEPYIDFDKQINESSSNKCNIAFPYTVGEGCVFVLGDNRRNSTDSRSFGNVDARLILGKAVFRTHPLKDWKIY